MKHSDDGGNLTLFGDGDEILIACDKGHFWTFDAKGGKVPKASPDAVRSLQHLERFGPAAMRALKPKD